MRLTVLAALAVSACVPAAHADGTWHHDIVTTNFWVGQVISSTSDGSQKISAYDENWEANYGGCDGVLKGNVCTFEYRTAANDYFPNQMTPKQNPFYLDLPLSDRTLKDRWVELRRGRHLLRPGGGRGPGGLRRPRLRAGHRAAANTRFNGAGMDVSPRSTAAWALRAGRRLQRPGRLAFRRRAPNGSLDPDHHHQSGELTTALG